MLRPSSIAGTIFCVTLMVILAFAALPAETPGQYVPGQIIVKFAPEVGEIRAQKDEGDVSLGIASLDRKLEKYQAHGLTQIFSLKKSQLASIYQFDFDSRFDALEVARDFATDGHILYAEPRYVYRLSEAPNDSSYVNGTQWYIDKVYGPAAWDIAHGDSTVIIGIVDSGVDWDHPDLADNIWFNSGEDLNGDGLFTAFDWNAVDDDGNGFVDDWHGWDFGGEAVSDNNPDEGEPVHGTHVAGIAAAVTDNEAGVAGMSWNCVIMPVKVSRNPYPGYLEYGYEGIQYAADNGADVINCSWGRTGGSPSSFEREIIDSAYAKGAILVAAAGNDRPGQTYAPPDTCPLHYPSWYNHVVAVAATDQNDRATSFTFYGTWVDVSAPGQSIYNTWWNDTYAWLGGTSMASPLVAGVAGLVKSVDPSLNSDEFEERMQTTSDEIDGLNPSYAGWLGGGRLNAQRALGSDAPETIGDLSIALESGSKSSAGDFRLRWSEPFDDEGVIRYVVYRSTAAGSLGDSLAGTADTTYLDIGAAGSVSVNYFYSVKSVDGTGNKSGESNKVGEFDRQLMTAP